MDTNIQSILDDLFAADPSLRQSEAQVRHIVEAMLAVRPKLIVDESFRQELREQLLARAQALTQTAPVSHNALLTLFSMNKAYYVFGGTVLAILLIVPIVYFNSGSLGSGSIALNSGTGEKISFAPSINAVGADAFGSLAPSGSSTVFQDSATSGSAAAPSPDAPKMSGPAFGRGGGGGGTPGATMIMPPQDYVQYRYVYAGDTLKLDGEAIQVLKRIKGVSGSSLSQFLKSFNFEGINLKSFGDSVLQNLNFIQDKQYGYNVSISLSERSLSIGENWEKWYSCPNGVCSQLEPLSIDQIPSDEKTIALAEAFVKEHGIDVSAYGAPEVQNDWRVMYERARVKEGYYIPDVLSVVYPLHVQGKPVYDDGGNKSGLHVNVNIRLNRVAGIWDFNSQKYQSSSYAAETDVKKILGFAERGGVYGYYDAGNAKIVDVELGTPEVAYLKYWTYNNGVSDELLVPSLVFPIVKMPDNPDFYRKSVIIPLAKELLEVPDGGPVNIMPTPLSELVPAPLPTEQK